MSGADYIECSECGHLHFDPSTRGYDACPIDGCTCPHAPRERSYRDHGEEIAAALAAHEAGEVRQLVSPDGPAVPSGHDDPLGELFRATTPKVGSPGVRIDAEGREWYSAAWIDLHPATPAAKARRGLTL